MTVKSRWDAYRRVDDRRAKLDEGRASSKKYIKRQEKHTTIPVINVHIKLEAWQARISGSLGCKGFRGFAVSLQVLDQLKTLKPRDRQLELRE